VAGDIEDGSPAENAGVQPGDEFLSVNGIPVTTRQDVIDFQTDTGLGADGIVGPKTWDALESLVTATPDERQEIALDDQFEGAIGLQDAGQYDNALAIYDVMIAGQTTPERIGPLAANAAVCHQQRGRFGLAVARYELALGGRLNQEGMRALVLENLMKARRNEFLAEPAPDPEPLPPGADGETARAREGGGVTEREPVKSGDVGPVVDLFKGKLAHMMVGWQPELPEGPVFDAATGEKTRQFQAACGLTESGEADASTWHAADSFTNADVPFLVVAPLFTRARVAAGVSETDPATALTLFEGIRDESRALRLTEIVKTTEAWIGRAHHKLSHFPEAVEHYNLYLDRTIPFPSHYGAFLEALRRAHQGLPAE
jgi:peptidoglycan hydrolase-like protein with peptidoglycan-binding domain